MIQAAAAAVGCAALPTTTTGLTPHKNGHNRFIVAHDYFNLSKLYAITDIDWNGSNIGIGRVVIGSDIEAGNRLVGRPALVATCGDGVYRCHVFEHGQYYPS